MSTSDLLRMERSSQANSRSSEAALWELAVGATLTTGQFDQVQPGRPDLD